MSTGGELRQLISMLSAFEAARRSGDDDALAVVRAEARFVLGPDYAAGADEPGRLLRAARFTSAEAVLAAVADHSDDRPSSGGSRALLRVVGTGLTALPRRVASEIRHIFIDRPPSILIRLAITVAISVSLVIFYEFSGWADYNAAQLLLYLFSAVGGSVVCTNALCFDADRVRRLLRAGVPPWRILITKNLAMLLMMLAAGLPSIALLWLGPAHVKIVVLLDQFVVMMFVWMGIANVLSVVSPLRHEPISARLKDGTWKRYLASFVISYGVGLTVNLIIYWQLWAREAASGEITGGRWSAFGLVLVSSILLWLLLTVFAAACGENRELRLILEREMVPYPKPPKPLRHAQETAGVDARGPSPR